MYRIKSLTAVVALIMIVCSPGVAADKKMAPTLNTFGTTGLIDMPTAESQPDAEINTTVSFFTGSLRNTLTFQITPRLSGSFRYSKITEAAGSVPAALFDRSFDLRYQVLKEAKYQPAVAIGLQDFVGTGVYSGEYIVATKQLLPTLKATVGIGWGRFGGLLGAKNRSVNFGVGGSIDTANWFRGDSAFFGGLEWQTPIKGLHLKIERSSDAYVAEAIDRGLFTQKSEINFGVNYQISESINLSAYYLYGAEFGAYVSMALNPKRFPVPSGLDGAPLPVLTRPILEPGQAYDTAWAQASTSNVLRKPVLALLKASDIKLEALKVEGTKATVYIRNTVYMYPAQAIGRAARALTRALPPSVETFEIVFIEEGMALAAITLSRSSIESLEHHPEGAEQMQQLAQYNSLQKVDPKAAYVEGLYPKFTWSLRPYSRFSLFDPDAPFLAEVGARLRGRIDFKPGLSTSGAIIKPVIGNLDNISRASNSVLPHVRSDQGLYYQHGDPVVERLTADYLFKLSPDIYARTTVGYLELMFGGISTELLWAPTYRNFSLGAELNYVKQRDFDGLFGLRPYSVATGHVSLYKDLWNGFEGQIDVGRYLAGDWGSTLTIDRTFSNGWKIGAFMTFTNVSFEDFGEGSFDKGITLSIPFSAGFGTSSRKTADLTIRPLTRDGGARLYIDKRLHDIVSGYDRPSVDASFGRFWR